jgi:hypothetical protein
MSRASIILLILLSLLACKKRRSDPMPTTSPVATAEATTTTGSTAQAADSWTTYKSAGGKFDVKTPEDMKEESSSNPTAAGTLETHMFTAKDGAIVYQIGYTDFPKSLVRASNTQKMLKGGEDGALNAIHGVAETSKVVTVQKYPGREFTTTAQVAGMQFDYIGRVIMVTNRLYQVQVLGPKGTVPETDRRRFIDSFHLAD